ncbi:MAG: YceD family protein [Vulcanimicrobiaceae bacterium]
MPASLRNTIDVGPLLGPGRRTIAVDSPIRLPAFEGLQFPSPAHVVLELRGADQGIRIEGTIDANAVGECRRCLAEVELSLHLEIDERVAPGEETDPVAESNVLAGERLNLEDLVRQLSLTALPMGVLCSEECRGLCPQCGRNRNAGACGCQPTGEDDNG